QSSSFCLQWSLALDDRPQGAVVDVPERNRAMIALKHDRICRGLGDVHRRTRSTVAFDVLLDQKSVVQNPDELRVLGFLAARIEARRTEPDLVRLPLAGPSARI